MSRGMRSPKRSDGGAARNLSAFDSDDVVSDYVAMSSLSPAESAILAGLLKPGLRVLDLGVGAGRTSSTLSADAERYVGLDFAPHMVEAARALHPELEFVVGDAADLSAFENESFDLVVFSYNGLDYVPDDDARRRCFTEVCRVLDDGGHFVFSSHNARALIRRPSRGGRLRRLALTVYMSARRAVRVLPDAAFWRGSGYVLDPVHAGLHTWTSTPAVIIAELRDAGFLHNRTVPGDHPDRGRSIVTPWWYYDFVAA